MVALVIGSRLGMEFQHYLDNKVLDSYKEVVADCKTVLEAIGVEESNSEEDIQKRANRWT